VINGASSAHLNHSQDVKSNERETRIKSRFITKINYLAKVQIFILYLCTKHTNKEDEAE